MPSDSNRSDVKEWAASYAFRDAKQMRKAHLSAGETGARIALSRMRNAFVAFHAGAPWMTGASRGVAEAYAQEAARLGAEVRRLRSAQREAAQRLRAMSDLPNDRPKTLADHVEDVGETIRRLRDLEEANDVSRSGADSAPAGSEEDFAEVWSRQLAEGTAVEDIVGGELADDLIFMSWGMTDVHDFPAKLREFLYGIGVPLAVQERVREALRFMVSSVAFPRLAAKHRSGRIADADWSRFVLDWANDGEGASQTLDLLFCLARGDLTVAQKRILAKAKRQSASTALLLNRLKHEAVAKNRVRGRRPAPQAVACETEPLSDRELDRLYSVRARLMDADDASMLDDSGRLMLTELEGQIDAIQRDRAKKIARTEIYGDAFVLVSSALQKLEEIFGESTTFNFSTLVDPENPDPTLGWFVITVPTKSDFETATAQMDRFDREWWDEQWHAHQRLIITLEFVR